MSKTFRIAALIICGASVCFLLWCIFVKNTYPPTSTEIAKKFHFILASCILTSSVMGLSFIYRGALKLKINPTDWLVLIFTLYLLLNTYLTQAPAITDISVLVILATLYFNIRVLVAADERFSKYIIIMLLLAGLGQVFIGFRQLYSGEASNHLLFKLTGSFYNPGPYAGFLAVIFSLAFCEIINLYSYAKNRLWEIKSFWELIRTFKDLDAMIFLLAILTAVAIIIIIPSTMSRTAWMTMVICSITILFYKYNFLSKLRSVAKERKVLSFFGGVLLLLLVVGIVVLSYNMKRNSADGRFLLWKISSKVILDKPIFGTGIGKFGAAYGEQQTDYFTSLERPEAEIAVAEGANGSFNDYLQIGASLGISGLILFLLLVSSIFYGCRGVNQGGIYAISAILIFGFASYPFTLISFQVVLVTLFAISSGNSRWIFGVITISYKTAIVIGGCLLLICVYCYMTINQVEEKYKEWQLAKQLYNMQNYEAANEGFIELYPDLYEYPEFLFEFGRSMNKTGYYTASNDILKQASEKICDPMIYNVMGNNYKALENFSAAEYCYQKAHDIVPNRIYPLHLLANLYFDSGQTEKALLMSQMIINFKEKVSSPATREIKIKAAIKMKEIMAE